jgi:hypothetical protein
MGVGPHFPFCPESCPEQVLVFSNAGGAESRGLFPVQDEPEGQGMLMMDDQRARNRTLKPATN